MTRKKLRSVYRFITLVILSICWFSLSVLFNIETPWYYFVMIFIASTLIGNFLAVYFAGIVVQSVKYMKKDLSTNQDFIMSFQLGITPIQDMHGTFDNSVNVSEEELAQLLHTHLTKKMLLPVLEYGEPQSIEISNRKHNLLVHLR